MPTINPIRESALKALLLSAVHSAQPTLQAFQLIDALADIFNTRDNDAHRILIAHARLPFISHPLVPEHIPTTFKDSLFSCLLWAAVLSRYSSLPPLEQYQIYRELISDNTCANISSVLNSFAATALDACLQSLHIEAQESSYSSIYDFPFSGADITDDFDTGIETAYSQLSPQPTT